MHVTVLHSLSRRVLCVFNRFMDVKSVVANARESNALVFSHNVFLLVNRFMDVKSFVANPRESNAVVFFT